MYQNILVAVDLRSLTHDEFVLRRAQKFAQSCQAKLTLIHAIEDIHAYGAAQAYQIIANAEEQIAKEAAKALHELADKMGVDADARVLDNGAPKDIIVKHASKIAADLIIFGCHKEHGFHLSFVSIVNSIIHHAPCDVLCIEAPQVLK